MVIFVIQVIHDAMVIPTVLVVLFIILISEYPKETFLNFDSNQYAMIAYLVVLMKLSFTNFLVVLIL